MIQSEQDRIMQYDSELFKQLSNRKNELGYFLMRTNKTKSNSERNKRAFTGSHYCTTSFYKVPNSGTFRMYLLNFVMDVRRGECYFEVLVDKKADPSATQQIADLVITKLRENNYAVKQVHPSDRIVFLNKLTDNVSLDVTEFLLNIKKIKTILDRIPRLKQYELSKEYFNSLNEKYHERISETSAPDSTTTKNETLTSGSPTENPLNTILYGPPGTGKTFRTRGKAISIISPTAEA